MTDKKIGIVSGVGPLAGADVLTKIYKVSAEKYKAVEDIEYPKLILTNLGVNGVGNTGKINKEFIKTVQGQVTFLEESGCSFIGIACNTAHLFLNKIKLNKHTTLINLPEEVAKFTHDQNIKDALLLCSAESKKQNLYQPYLNKYGISYSYLKPNDTKLLDYVIGLVMAYKIEDSSALISKILDSYRGKPVLASCTELPVAINQVKTIKDKVIDSNYILALALADSYYDGQGS
ncbi:aspartate/glutamate racemase family protein [Candidatus Saccharibacteria bacterium]|nr:aspartate/glutamate racemase family protein [Candidatus Saccharibacteria bacterium]